MNISKLSSQDTKQPIFLLTNSSEYHLEGLVCIPTVFFKNSVLDKYSAAELPAGAVFIADRVAMSEKDERRKQALKRARERLGAWQEKESATGATPLAILRRKSGMSQEELALKMGTKQANVSRFERAPSEMKFATMNRLAEALGIQIEAVVAAIRRYSEQEASCEE